MDAVIICVPTPLNEYREPDLTFIEATGRMIAPQLRAGQLVFSKAPHIQVPQKKFSYRYWKKATNWG